MDERVEGYLPEVNHLRVQVLGEERRHGIQRGHQRRQEAAQVCERRTLRGAFFVRDGAAGPVQGDIGVIGGQHPRYIHVAVLVEAKHGSQDFRAFVAGIFQPGKRSERYPGLLGEPDAGPVVGDEGLRRHSGSEMGETLAKIHRLHEEKKVK